jgi:hypothetical protein
MIEDPTFIVYTAARDMIHLIDGVRYVFVHSSNTTYLEFGVTLHKNRGLVIHLVTTRNVP